MAQSAVDMSRSAEAPSPLARWFEALHDMRGSVRKLNAEEPPEGRLVFFVLLSSMITFLSWTMKGVIVPSADAGQILPIALTLYLLATLILRTAGLYLSASVIGWVCRWFGGQGSARQTRMAMFWGALVAAPIGLAFAILNVALVQFATGVPQIALSTLNALAYLAGSLAFFWYVGAALAEAHQFRSTALVVTLFLLASIAVGGVGLYLSGAGGLL
ncbi:MAG: YIP1 family protein [Pseudomonadota bacterium]